jgi:hypothetical protein
MQQQISIVFSGASRTFFPRCRAIPVRLIASRFLRIIFRGRIHQQDHLFAASSINRESRGR